MKNVIAKVNAKGATVFYRDGKRISRAQLTAAYVDEARAEMTRQGVDVAGENNKDGFVVQVLVGEPVACEFRPSGRADIEAVFTVNVGTVTAGLQVMKAARKLDTFHRAIIYDAYEYADRDYERWHMTRGALILHSNGHMVTTQPWGHVFDALIDELGTGFAPVTDYQKAKADRDEAAEQCKRAEERKRECQEILNDKREYRDKAIVAKALRLTA